MDDTDSPSNAPAFSVSELAFALKRTIEDAYGHVRLKGEVSKVTRHSSGHVYLTLKDDKASLDGVIWKGSVRQLAIQPTQGLEVIVTGKITTFPAGSRYQIVIEQLEPAGVGALLAQLERLKARLEAEGLFAPSRKQPLPAMPACIGVITSPTGAVIRDILHRLKDRWPCRVVVWPVVVQGEQASVQVANAIRGFNNPDSRLPRPDVLIVARGGGSVEDLWAFNDEALARTVAQSTIPLISAVGHETDTTLIDFVSDRRAPTPTAAAEMATPVLLDLKASIAERAGRLQRAGARLIEDRRHRLVAGGRGLPRPTDLLGGAQQRLDTASLRLGSALRANTDAHERVLTRTSARLRPGLLLQPVAARADRLASLDLRRAPALDRLMVRLQERLVALDRQRLALDPDRPLKAGFARIHDRDGQLVRSSAGLEPGQGVDLVFADGRAHAIIDPQGAASQPGASRRSPRRPAARPAPADAASDGPPGSRSQGDLF